MNRTLRAAVLALCLSVGSTALAAPGDISLTINNGSIKDVLNAISSISGRSIVADDSVTGNITIDLHDVSFETAMDIVTKSKGLSYKDMDGVVVVSNIANMTKNFGDVQIFKLHYAKVEEVQKAISGLLDGGKISVDPVTNSILFSGSTQDEARVKAALKRLDVATKQVTLEAQIISLDRTDAKNLGVAWGWDKVPYSSDSSSGSSDSDDDFGGHVNFGAGYQFRFTATVNALISNGKGKVLATPRLITVPGKEASIFIGSQIPVVTQQTTNGVTSTTTEYKDAGLKLVYTPVVGDDGMITSVVHTEVSTYSKDSETNNYIINKRDVDTNVRMRNGETLVIGGLIQEQELRAMQKVPFLSNIPILGELFKNRTKSTSKTEVIMLLTPHLTAAGESPAIYDTTGALAEFKHTNDDVELQKEIKKSEKGEAEEQLRYEQRQVKREMAEVEKEYAKANSTDRLSQRAPARVKPNSSTSATENTHSMRDRVNRIMAEEK